MPSGWRGRGQGERPLDEPARNLAERLSRPPVTPIPRDGLQNSMCRRAVAPVTPVTRIQAMRRHTLAGHPFTVDFRSAAVVVLAVEVDHRGHVGLASDLAELNGVHVAAVIPGRKALRIETAGFRGILFPEERCGRTAPLMILPKRSSATARPSVRSAQANSPDGLGSQTVSWIAGIAAMWIGADAEVSRLMGRLAYLWFHEPNPASALPGQRARIVFRTTSVPDPRESVPGSGCSRR